MSERSLVLVKPDGVRRGLVGEVISRIESKGLRIVALELRTLDRGTAEMHYAEHVGKPFHLPLIEFITSGPLVAMVIEGPRVIEMFRSMAGPTVEFLGRQPDAVVSDYARQCKALLFPGEEDFGIAPLEINAAGRPVIAFRAGGALETVVEGVSGTFFDQPASASLAGAILRCEKQDWNVEAIRAHALRFDERVFAARVRVFVDQVTASPVFPGAFC